MGIVSGTDASAVRAGAAQLAAGELVAFATETVYGLGARADDTAAVARIFQAKGRPADHPLIVHVASMQAAEAFATELSPTARRLAAAFWPGPLTLIVPRRPGIGAAAAGGQGSIGLRMPSHPVALALLREAAALGVAGVAAPSANRFGRVSPTLASHVADEFGDGLTVLDGGPSQMGIESAIVDCTRPQPALLRPGPLSATQLEAVLGQALAAPDAASPRVPGALVSHYAPAAAVHLFDVPPEPAGVACSGASSSTSNSASNNVSNDASNNASDNASDSPSNSASSDALTALLAQVAARHLSANLAGQLPGLLGVYSRTKPQAGPAWLHKAMPAQAAAVAHELFAVLREFDAAGVAAIWVERPPPGPDWAGVQDRLQRAAA